MTGRHARRTPFPFWVLLVVLGAVGTAVVGATSVADGGPASSGGPSERVVPAVTGAPPSEDGSSPAVLPSQAPRGRVVIHGTGDVSLDPSYIPALVENGYPWAWSGLDGLFRRDDLTVINHECPSTNISAPIPKTFSFRCDPDALPAAEQAGVDVASLANNHGYDQGPEGLLDSIRNVRAAGIAPVGAGPNERAAERPALFEVNGWTVAVVGFGEVLDPLDQTAGPDKAGTATGHSLPLKLRAIRAADRVADIVIVTIHWGVELDTRPRDYQVDEGHAMVEAGADVIFGHHAHRLQPPSRTRDRPPPSPG
jgi:Bacterial capsule synthesis protein PGA_cap